MKKLITSTVVIMFITSLVLITACKKKESSNNNNATPIEDKQPVASFTSDKVEYVGGETMTLTSTSTDAGAIKWVLPDGTTSNEKIVSYLTSTTSIELNLSVRLDVTSPHGTKTDYVVKNIKIRSEAEEAQPVASFTTDKTEYYGGETIILTSTSTGTGTIEWRLPNGQNSYESVLNFNTPPNPQTELTWYFELIAKSPNGTKIDTIGKSVKIKPGAAGVYLSKNFSDNSITSEGWTNVSVVNSSVYWNTTPSISGGINIITPPYGFVSGYYSSSYHASECWLISPVINLSPSTNPILTFQNAYKNTGNALKCYVSTNYNSGNPSTATWVELTFTSSSGNGVFANSGNISLSNYKTANTRVAFKYTSTNSAASNWALDDIIVKEN